MRKLALMFVVLAVGVGVAQAQTTMTTSGDIAVDGNWSSGLPTLANPGTIGSGFVGDRATDVDITGAIVVGDGGSLTDNISGYNNREMHSGGTLTVLTGGQYQRNSAMRLSGGAIINAQGGAVSVVGLVGFRTGGSRGFTVNVTDNGTFTSDQLVNYNGLLNGLAPETVNVTSGSATLGVAINDGRLIDEGKVFFNVSGGSLTLSSLSYAAGADDTNIVATISNDGLLVTHNFDTGNNATALADRYVDLLGEDGASWTWTGKELSDFEALWVDGTLKHDTENTGTFAQNFTVTGDTLTVIPEPASLGLVAVLGGFILFLRRRVIFNL